MDLALNNLQWLMCHKTQPITIHENGSGRKAPLLQTPNRKSFLFSEFTLAP